MLEAYSVLTRLPPPYRIPADIAKRAIEESLDGFATVPNLAARDAWEAMEFTAQQALGGGRIYDAVIAKSSRAAGASVLLTWNVRHFELIAPEGLEVRQP